MRHMSINQADEGKARADRDPEKPELRLGEIMDYYREELRLLQEQQERALVEAEVAMKLARR